MKKAGIITHFEVHNHGAVLQLYALKKVLEEAGFDAKALRYKKNYDFMPEGIEKKYSISVRSIPFYIKYLFKNGIKRTLFNIKKRKILQRFKNDKNLIGEYYTKATDLDLAVVGSDEVFSIESGLNPCFFGMGVNAKRIIAYGASCGPTTKEDISARNASSFFKAGVENFDAILVRDYNTKTIVEDFGKTEAQIVCDPVLLYDFKTALNKEINDFKSKIKRKYCVIYSYDYNMNDAETVSAIKRYAKEKGFKTVSVGFYHKWCDKNINVDPISALIWFSAADAVFTDTFHGTVFSIAMQVDFYTKVRSNANKLDYLLTQYGFEDRKVESFGDDLTATHIDYSEKSATVLSIRENSLKLLKASIDGEHVN